MLAVTKRTVADAGDHRVSEGPGHDDIEGDVSESTVNLFQVAPQPTGPLWSLLSWVKSCRDKTS